MPASIMELALLPCEIASEPNSEGTLAGVKEQGKDAGKPASDSRNVGGANVAAAGLAHILFGEYSSENQSKRNGAEKVCQENQK